VDAGEVIGEAWIEGKPRPKGSLKPNVHRRRNGRMAVTLHDDPDSEAWKLKMIAGIREQCKITPVIVGRVITGFDPAPYPGPVQVYAAFYFERRQSVNGGPLPTHATDWPMADDIGDTDKLQRNLGDALEQSGLIANDRNIIRWRNPIKLWADGIDECAGVSVRVVAL
jgi:Holliday junction resolvase RusA-like endonuclease